MQSGLALVYPLDTFIYVVVGELETMALDFWA